MPAIGWWKVNKPRQPIAGLLRTRFLPWTNKASTCRKALFKEKKNVINFFLNEGLLF